MKIITFIFSLFIDIHFEKRIPDGKYLIVNVFVSLSIISFNQWMNSKLLIFLPGHFKHYYFFSILFVDKNIFGATTEDRNTKFKWFLRYVPNTSLHSSEDKE